MPEVKETAYPVILFGKLFFMGENAVIRLFVIFVFGILSSPLYATDFSSVVSSARRSVVQILEGESVVGTGFLVRPDVVATNVHVLASLSKPQVQNYDGLRSTGFSVLAFDAQRDLALIRVANKGTPLKIQPKIPASGSEVLALGHPRGLEMTATTGTVSAIRSQGDLIQTDAAVNPGNSGGPLIDKSGRVVGVVVSRLSGSEGLGFAVPIHHVEQLLKSDRPAMTLEQFSTALYADSGYVESILQSTPRRLKESNGKGIWQVQSINSERMVLAREYLQEDQVVGMSWVIDLKRQKKMIYSGASTQSLVCFLPGSPESKVCRLEFPTGALVKDQTIKIMADYGKLDCASCSLENTSRKQLTLVAAMNGDQPVATGAAGAIQRANDVQTQRERERTRQAAEDQRRAADRACVGAMESARQSCGREGALQAMYCGQARANIENFCR